MLLYIIITLIITLLVLWLPSIYDLGGFSRVYDLHSMVAKEFPITKPQNIVSHYFPAPFIQTTTNVTYQVDALSNTINLKIANIDYSFQLESELTKQIIIPILLGEVNP